MSIALPFVESLLPTLRSGFWPDWHYRVRRSSIDTSNFHKQAEDVQNVDQGALQRTVRGEEELKLEC